MPVGSTNFGFAFASTAGANINQGESATGRPAKKDGGAGFSQIGLDDKGGFANLDFIDEFTLSPEQIAAGIAAIADPGSINRDAAFATIRHTIESHLNAGLATEIQHEAVGQVRGEQALETNNIERALANNDSIVGISDLDLGLQSTPPGGNGSVSNLEASILRKSRFSRSSLKRTSPNFKISRE